VRPWSCILGVCVAGGLLPSACAPPQRGEPDTGGKGAQDSAPQIIGEIIHHISDQLPLLPLFYDAEPALIGRRLVNVSAAHGVNSTQTWNAHEWDVKG
jgi:hypothetical protein